VCALPAVFGLSNARLAEGADRAFLFQSQPVELYPVAIVGSQLLLSAAQVIEEGACLRFGQGAQTGAAFVRRDSMNLGVSGESLAQDRGVDPALRRSEAFSSRHRSSIFLRPTS